MIVGLISLNADFREAMKESMTSATPVVDLFAPHAGPFTLDADKSKQTRMIGVRVK